MARTALEILRNSPGRQALLVGLLFLGLYLAFPTADYSYDAIGYVGFIHQAAYGEFPAAAWHEYHILYIPMGYAAAGVLIRLGFLPDVLVLMQVLNALFSVLALSVFFRLLRDETGASVPALLGTGFLAFSHAFWYYATDPEVYPPALFFLLLAFRSGVKWIRDGGWRDAARAGLWQGLAVGFHVAAALLAPILLAGWFLSGGRGRRPAGLAGTAAQFASIALLVALLPYGLKYRLADDTSIVEGLTGRLAYAVGQESAEGTRWFLGAGFDPWLEFRGIQRGFAAAPAAASAVPAAAASLLRGFVAVLFLLPLLGVRRLYRVHPVPTLILMAWFLLFFVFFTLYNVGSVKFVPFLLAPLLCLSVLAVAPFLAGGAGRNLLRFTLAVVCVLLFGINLAGRILPGSRIDNNRDYRRTVFIRDHTAVDDLVVHLGMGENIRQKVYLPYFGGRRELILDLRFRGGRGDPEEILSVLEAGLRQRLADGGRVVILSEVIDATVPLARFERRHSLPPGALRDLFVRLGPRLLATLDPDFSLYILEPA